jgi:putative ABC transport system permease protein
VRDLGELSSIPAAHLAAIIVGTPAAAAGAGWLLAGREPSAVARQPIE